MKKKKNPHNVVGFKRDSLYMQTLKVFKNNYFRFFEKKNAIMRTCNIHILESLGKLNLA